MNRSATFVLLAGLAATAASGQSGQLRVTPQALSFATRVDSDAPATISMVVMSDSPIGFQAKATTVLGGNWLSVDQAVATTPAQINVQANRRGLAVGTYAGSIALVSANGTLLTVAAQLNVCAVPKGPQDPCIPGQGPVTDGLTVTPGAISLTVVRGSSAVATSIVVQGPASQTVSVRTSTKDNGNWLTVDKNTFQPPYSLSVTGAGQNMAAGNYEGEVDFDVANQPTTKVAVLMRVLNPAVPVTSIDPSFVAAPSPDTMFTITGSGFQAGAQVQLTVSTATNPNVDVLLPNAPTVVDAKTMRVLIPGTFLAQAGFVMVRVINPNSVPSDPLKLTVGHPTPEVRPNGLSNSASLQGNRVSPGQLITIFGVAMGPASPATGTVDDSGTLSRQVSGVRVLFDGQPAGLLYVSDTQINAVAPNSIAGQSETQIVVEYNGTSSAAVRTPVAAAVPGIFTATGTGTGALLEVAANATAATPGPGVGRGEVMTFYATGAGLIQGSAGNCMVAKGINQPLLPVTVQIGGQDAEVLYAGTSPGQLEAVLQVNVRVPQSVQAGSDVPVDLVVGGTHGQSGVTLVVK